MNKHRRLHRPDLVGALVLTCGLASCLAPVSESQPGKESLRAVASPWGSVSTPTADEPQTGGMPQLYGRDGLPVDARAAGAATAVERPGRDVQPKDGSRMYILELYQRAIEEKEALELELTALSAALEQSRDAHASLAGVLQTREAELNAVRGDLERERQTALELAERLATAQIRRLEAEKMLLEAKIEWQRVQDLVARPGNEGDRR